MLAVRGRAGLHANFWDLCAISMSARKFAGFVRGKVI